MPSYRVTIKNTSPLAADECLSDCDQHLSQDVDNLLGSQRFAAAEFPPMPRQLAPETDEYLLLFHEVQRIGVLSLIDLLPLVNL